MGFWPFGGGKKNKSGQLSEKSRDLAHDQTGSDAMARSEKASTRGFEKSSRTKTTKPYNEKSRTMAKLPAYDAKAALLAQPARSQPSPVPVPNKIVPLSANKPAGHKSGVYSQHPTSNSSLGPETFSAERPIPTLHARRSDTDSSLMRRKSSKRKADDHHREQEVRAMSSSPIPIPKRPGTYSDSPLRRETKKIPGNLGRHLGRPASDVSLPLPESLSEMEVTSNQNSFKIRAWEVLSPRPTVRYNTNPRTSSGKEPAQSRTSIPKALIEEDASSQKRIDELADGLDSGGLRELMERDRKRREKKREEDRQKLQRRLQRRADRQREEEEQRARSGTVGPSSPSRPQVATRTPDATPEPAIAGVAAAVAAVAASSQQRENAQDPFADPDTKPAEVSTPIRNPFADERDVESTLDPFAGEEDNEPTLPVRSPLREAPATETGAQPQPQPQPQTLSPPTSPAQQPKELPLLPRQATPDIAEDAEPDRRASAPEKQPISSWATFFRRGVAAKRPSVDRGRKTPLEFSNTSRESFIRQQNVAPIVPARSFQRASSGTPQRTQSKFREDLPELPISPPDSRVQSPEAGTAHDAVTVPQTAAHQEQEYATESRALPDAPAAPIDIVGSRASEPGPPTIVMSQSLASVDSEGSWLSGKPVKRTSAQMAHPLRQSQSSITAPVVGAFDDEAEANDIANDEYLSRLSPAPGDDHGEVVDDPTRKPSSTIIDRRGEANTAEAPDVPPLPNVRDERWHGSVGRQPTIIRQAGRAKSKEGLLHDYQADEADTSPLDEGESLDLEGQTADVQDSPLLRARSVEYRGHARHISAGSARLLDIRRTSIQSERSNVGEKTPITPVRPNAFREEEKESEVGEA